MTKTTNIIYVVTDKQGNPQDEHGNPYGWFLPNEEELAKAYCEKHGLAYHEKEEVFIKY